MSGLLALAPIVGPLIGKALDLFEGDDKEKLKLFQQELEIAAKDRQSQIVVNQNEATHQSIFVAGWRPGLMWMCIFACGVDWIIRPFLPYFGFEALPSILNDHMWEIMFGVLGLGGMRTYEKTKRRTL